MKFIIAALLALPSSIAMAEKFLGGASGSIENLRCYSTFEGREKDYVTITKQARDKDGYVDELQLKGVWYDQNTKEHFAYFDVIYVSADESNLLIVGKSPERNAIELNIPLSINPDEAGESTMKINAVRQDFLKFNCNVVRAG